MKDGDEAKFWLWPEVSVAKSEGFNFLVLRRLVRVVEDNRSVIERAWHDYFG